MLLSGPVLWMQCVLASAPWQAAPHIFAVVLQDNQLADAAHWCREYAKINAVALRKILEQHDRMLHNNSGQRLLQVNLIGSLTKCASSQSFNVQVSQPHRLLWKLICWFSCVFLLLLVRQ